MDVGFTKPTGACPHQEIVRFFRAHLDPGGLVQQPLEEGAAAADRKQGGYPEGEQLSNEALKLRAEDRLEATLLGKIGREGEREGTDYARMSMDQSRAGLIPICWES